MRHSSATGKHERSKYQTTQYAICDMRKNRQECQRYYQQLLHASDQDGLEKLPLLSGWWIAKTILVVSTLVDSRRK